MHIANAHKQPWLGIIAWVLLGGWITWDQLSSYFERGDTAYLVMAAGYALFTFFLCISIFVDAPANRERFTRKQILIAKIAPFAALGITFIGLWLRWGHKL
jgi:hypothetical protein